MRIACLQFAPELGKVQENISRANVLLGNASPGHFSLLVLPEMAFSGLEICPCSSPRANPQDPIGYNHPSFDAIWPFLEPTGRSFRSLRLPVHSVSRIRQSSFGNPLIRRHVLESNACPIMETLTPIGTIQELGLLQCGQGQPRRACSASSPLAILRSLLMQTLPEVEIMLCLLHLSVIIPPSRSPLGEIP